MSKLVEGKRYWESELALAVEAEGWMRSDLGIAAEYKMVTLDLDGPEPVVVVLPDMAGAFEVFLDERAKFWRQRLAELRAEIAAALAEEK